MEHASFGDQQNATFSLTEEDHTLANALRFTLNQDPRVIFCGYSIPHPRKRGLMLEFKRQVIQQERY
ncbi:hypothetical protein NL676_039110 [Syzygium grande]|nr:hypothetical protein NL676_039110 [Syzygium grande]